MNNIVDTGNKDPFGIGKKIHDAVIDAAVGKVLDEEKADDTKKALNVLDGIQDLLNNGPVVH